MAPRDSKFNIELARFMNACNIHCNTWTRINSKPFQDFFAYLGKPNLPDESTIRTQLSSLHDGALTGVREYIGESWIYIQVDEARIADRAIASVLVGRLDGQPSVSHCLNIVEVRSQITYTSIAQIVNDSLNILWPDQIFYDRVKLIVTDQASYMLKAGRSLKLLYPDLLHITCLCHALHSVSEKVHSDYKSAKKFVEKFCKILSRAPRRQNLLSFMINSPIHSLPVITRWGTWLSFCGFLNKHLDKIKDFIKEIDDEDNQAIEVLSNLASSQALQRELIEINQL